jgi:hypothetical protein
MTARGSKSARNAKPQKTPAEGDAPEVKIDAGTTVVLPNPTDAPATPKPSRKKKAPPTVAEIPDWAKRAATRDTTAEMAAVPEAAPVADAPAPKKGRAPKATAKPAAKATPTATPGTLQAIGDAWLDSLRAAGHTPSTVSSYGNDLAIAFAHLGADTAAGTITERQIASFDASKGVTRKANGKPKAQPTILKTRRALRLALVWAEQKKLIAKAPYAAKTSA